MQPPTYNPVTLPFGSTARPYSDTNRHRGRDYGYLNERGQVDYRVFMPCTARVTVRPLNGDDGNAVYFTDPHGNTHALCHLSRIDVVSNQTVPQGTLVGLMGDTGRAFGVHLHWACRKPDGTFIDPQTLMAGRGGATNNTQGDVHMDEDAAKETYRVGLFREPENDQIWRHLLGRRPADVLRGVRGSQEWLGINHQLKVELPELRQRLAAVGAELEVLRNRPPEVVTKEVEKIRELCTIDVTGVPALPENERAGVLVWILSKLLPLYDKTAGK